MLQNQKSLPKGGSAADHCIGDYEAVLRQIKTVKSQYVTVKNPAANEETPGPSTGRGNYRSPYD